MNGQAMAMFPDVQMKAQAEIDEIIGSNVLPSREHLKSLKYVNRVTKETVRWYVLLLPTSDFIH
jgi:hypothetical protein